MSYWRGAIEAAMDEAGLHSLVPADKWDELARSMQFAAEMESEATGRCFIPNPETERANRAERELRAEQGKVPCKTCAGGGVLVSHGPYHSAISPCWKCNGEGKHKP